MPKITFHIIKLIALIIKIGMIMIYCSVMYMMFTLTDAVYEKGFNEGVKSVTIGVNNG